LSGRGSAGPHRTCLSGLGAEIAPESLPGLYAHLKSHLPAVCLSHCGSRGRATGVLLAVGTPRRALTEVARQGAAALELANPYTDVFEAVRRRRAMSPTAEMQLALLPCARVVRVAGAELAGGVLPSPDVGGDWFDWSDNRDGTWLAIADPDGNGPITAGARRPRWGRSAPPAAGASTSKAPRSWPTSSCTTSVATSA
jgi:hypothetical protein